MSKLSVVLGSFVVATLLISQQAEAAVVRLTLQLSEFGDGTFRIEKTSQPPNDDFAGTPFTFSLLPHTKATKGRDGMFRLIHDFTNQDDLDALALEKYNITTDKDSGYLSSRRNRFPAALAAFRSEPNCFTPKGYVSPSKLSATLSNTVAAGLKSISTIHLKSGGISIAGYGWSQVILIVPSGRRRSGLSLITGNHILPP